MDKQQVLELARQAGLGIVSSEGGDSFVTAGHADGVLTADLLAFAELVAQAERERCREICLEVNKGALEASESSDVRHYDAPSYMAGYQDAAVDCDEAIRG